MKRHMQQARAKLGELGALHAKTEAAEHRILKAAEQRLAAVVAALDKLAPGAEGADDTHQDSYLALVAERGQLHIVIAKARAALAD